MMTLESTGITPGKRPASAKSQGLVEFALILPVLLLLIFVIIELARVLHAWLAIENGARFGVRYAVTREYDLAYCSAVKDNRCEDLLEEPPAQIQSIKDAAKAGAVAILRNESTGWSDPGYFKVTVCTRDKYQPPDPAIPFDSADCLPDEDPGEPGEFVSVTVDFNHPLITPFLTATWPQLHLHSRREAIVEEFRTSRVVKPPEGLPTLIPTNTFTVSPTFTASLTSTPTHTSSPTYTPTPSPTPDCSDITMTGMWISGDDVEANIRNRNDATAYLIHTHLEWEELRSAMYANKFELDNFEYWNGDDDSSPTDVSTALGSVPLPGGGNTDRFEGDFNGEPYEPIWGDYRLEMTFDFLDWGGGPCTVSRSISVEQVPPPPTRTPRPAPTSGPSPTPKDTSVPKPTKTPKPTDPPGATDTPKPPPEPTDPPEPTVPPVGD